MSKSDINASKSFGNSKFAREDEQILALNYENLCDADYLNRLFSSEVNQLDQEESHAVSNHKWLITEDIAEDILLFGDADELGREFLIKKSLHDVPGLSSSFDPLTALVMRQIRIFEHVGRLILDRCSNDTSTVTMTSKDKIKTKPSGGHLISRSLTCVLQVLEESSRYSIQLSVLEPILNLVLQSYQPPNGSTLPLPPSPSASLQIPNLRANFNSGGIAHGQLTGEQLEIFRKILCNATVFGLSNTDSLVEQSTNVLEGFGVAINCSYGFLSIGLYSKNIGDVLIAILHLLIINMRADERHAELASESIQSIQNLNSNQDSLLSEKLRMKAKLVENKAASNLNNNKYPGLPTSMSDDGEIRDREHDRSLVDHKAVHNTVQVKKWEKSALAKLEKSPRAKLQIIKARANIELDDTVSVAISTTSGSSGTIRNKQQQVTHSSDACHSSSRSVGSNSVHSIKHNADNQNRRIRMTIEKMLHVPPRILKILRSGSRMNATTSSHLDSKQGQVAPAKYASEIWTCGQNSYGELGHGDITQRRSFLKVACMEGRSITAIGAGNEHTVFVSREGKLYVSGYNDNGQCGVGTNHQVRVPVVVNALTEEDIEQVHVYNGCEHTLVITRDGKLFAFGYNYRGQLGLGTATSESIPRVVKSLLARKVVSAACSYHHSIVLTGDGGIHTFGRNDCGQLGHGDNADRKLPQLIHNHPKGITKLSCGQFHTVVVTNTGTVYACGKNDYGQLGLEGTDVAKTFTRVSCSSEIEPIVQVCCGYYHTLLLSQNGVVYGCGRNDYGQLGLGHSQPRIHGCQPITALRDKNVVQIAAGCYHSIAVTSNGMLYVFGRNNHGQLGTGDTDERHSPHPVDDFVGRRIITVAAGFYHTVVLSVDALAPVDDDVPDQTSTSVFDPTIRSDSDFPGILSLEPSAESPSNDKDTIDIGKDLVMHSSNAKIVIGEVIVPLLEQLRGMEIPSNSENEDAGKTDDCSIEWIACQLRSLSILMSLIRRFITQDHTHRDILELPFSEDEAVRLLHSLVQTACNFLKSKSSVIKTRLGDEKDHAKMHDDFDVESLSSGRYSSSCSWSAAGLARQLHRRDCNGTPKEGGDLDILVESLVGVRKEIVFAYFSIPIEVDIGQFISNEASRCLSKYFGVLFPTPRAKSQFLAFLAHSLAKMSLVEPQSTPTSTLSSTALPLDMDMDHMKCLRLFSSIFFKYRRMNEVIKLFRSSHKHGLIIFQQLLVVYNRVSMICLENKFQQGTSALPSQCSQAVVTLEHCSANFAKCAIPLIFSKSIEVEEIEVIGVVIIQQIFGTAETVLEVMTSTQHSEQVSVELMAAVRFGTVLPSVLPTLLLSAMSYIASNGIVKEMLPHLRSLIFKLQVFGKSEFDRIVKTTSQSKIEHIESSEATANQKKELLMNTWWSRLLKYSVMLCARIASSLIAEESSSQIVIPQREVNVNAEQLSQQGLLHHRLWRYCYGPADIEVFHSIQQVVVAGLEVGDKVTQCCKVLRDRENVFNHTYRVLWQAAKASNTVALVEDIERMILDSIIHMEGVNSLLPGRGVTEEVSRYRLRPLWALITGVTKSIQSKRSHLISHTNLGWKDILLIIHSVVKAVRLVISECHPRMTLCALPSSRRWHQAFRRVTFVLVCLARWKSCRRLGMKKQGEAVVDFVSCILHNVVFSLEDISDAAVQSRWASTVASLTRGVTGTTKLIQGIAVMSELLNDIDFPSMKADVATALTASWVTRLSSRLQQFEANRAKSDENNGENSSMSRTVTNQLEYEDNPLACLPVCCEWNVQREKQSVQGDLIQTLQQIIGQFSETAKDLNAIAQGELTVIAMSVKFLELNTLDTNVAGLFQSMKVLPHLHRLLLALDERLTDLQVTDERGVARRSQAKEKLKSIRRTSSAIASFIQVVSIRMSCLAIDGIPGLFSNLLLVHAQLLSYFQRSRLTANLNLDQDVRCKGPSSPPDKDGKKGKDSGSNHRRRCQEIISQPLQFVRGQEGFVIQGEKLLSNYKGIDFTLSVWIYLSKKPVLRYSFITGKVSHNDAWPLVVLRGSDSKIDIIYGRGNEFERFTTQGAIPLHTWTHIVLVTEPRKIKVFLNGNMDTQANTPGNARAILYPVVIGSCPQGVRTRVDHVRDGFEGLLSNFKYYTRALSPIHVRVIFDQGPPESHDVCERWTYQLLSSCKALVEVHASVGSPGVYRRVADVLHLIFVTDTGRLRNAALCILERILSLDILDDITLSSNTVISAACVQPSGSISEVSIVGATFLSEYSSFRERLVLYLIRMIGCCWAPALATSAEGSNTDSKVLQKHQMNDRVMELFHFCPVFIGEKFTSGRQFPSASQNSCVIDKCMSREELAGELCQLLIGILRSLANKERWKDSISSIIYRSLCKFRGAVDVRREWTPLMIIDILGASVFLGDLPTGPYVGGVVESYFSESVSRVLNVDKTTNNATLLAYSTLSDTRQLLVVRISDLTSYSLAKDDLVLREFVTHSMLDLMDSLRPFVQLLLSDLVCVYRPDHPFLRHTMLKALRPMEVFIFYQMMRYLTRAACILPSELRLRQSLFHTFMQFCTRTLRLQNTADDVVADRAIPSLWSKCSRHLASMTEKVIVGEFPPADGERFFHDYATKHLGIVGDAFHVPQNTKLMKSGMLSELLYCLTNQHGDLSPLRTTSDSFVINDSGSSGELSENDAALTLRLVYHLRRSLIQLSRSLLSVPLVDDSTFASLPPPRQMLLWHSAAQTRSNCDNLPLTKLIHGMNSRLHTSLRTEVTYCLASSLRYAAISFFQLSASKASGNIIESTDLFSRLMYAAFSWITFHMGNSYEMEVCFQFLKMLLPSLNFVESPIIELQILQLCRQSLHRLLSRLISGQEPTKELLELSRTNNFNVLWTRAQEQLNRERGNAEFRVSPLTQSLTQLAVGLQIVQRCGGFQNKSFKSLSGNANAMSMAPSAPKTSLVRATYVELDLHLCLSKFEGLGDGVILEVQMGALLDGEPELFETIYRGSSSRLTQCGLSPRSSYAVRCRALFGTQVSKWSAHIDFDTDLGNLFLFDQLKCGPDILISEDGLTASYTGDDCWSTVLGTQAISCGVCSWEIRVLQSSTAYIFVGVARSSADLHTFLGGCSEGWGFIGEQALYHNREKVKVYGDAFSSGDIIGVMLDLNTGTLSFSRNGKMLGLAFDKMHGELFPAVAFYNVGQEVEIIADGCHATSPCEPIPCSPSRVNMDELCLLADLLYSVNNHTPLPHRVLEVVTNRCTAWCAGTLIRRRATSGRGVFIATQSATLQAMGMRAGERLRTPYGVVEIVGSAYDRVWFRVDENHCVWYFTNQQIHSGRERNLFQRCSYETGEVKSKSVETKNLVFEVSSMAELIDSVKWTSEMDAALVGFLLLRADQKGISPWDVTADEVCKEFRSLQHQLSRIVIASTELSHRWGISGPKRKAVLGRLALLRELNHLLEHSLAVNLLDTTLDAAVLERRIFDEFVPTILTLVPGTHAAAAAIVDSFVGSERDVDSSTPRGIGQPVWPKIALSWMSSDGEVSQSSLLPTVRHRIFTDLKMKHFWEIAAHSAVKAHKTDDDYDYPDDLPQVKLNRFKSFRAKEASELYKISGEDSLFSSMFCQLWKELRQHPQDKLRISYTHPMDDGQSRTFKVKFDNEGVDDYGGPYREIFQQLCDELQAADPSQVGAGVSRPSSWNTADAAGEESEKPPVRCFLPLLSPTPNWTAGECVERYKYIFNPSTVSPVLLDLYRFLGQLVGIALRSKITLDIQFPSYIWKCVVRESLNERDIASFDAPAADFVSHLAGLYKRLSSTGEGPEALSVLKEEVQVVTQDLNWTARRSDGRLVELVPGGAKKSVVVDELGLYLKLYVEARLSEGQTAVEAFREGLLSIIPETAIALLTWEELQRLVCGARYIDVERLRANTEYDDDVTPEDSHIVAFWEVLREFSEEEKSLFLKFVWARPTLPPKGVEFPQKLKIQSAVGDDATLKPDQYLPKAHTCFFSMNLPRYSCKEILTERLRYAITNCTEMDADFRLTELEVTGWNNV